MPSDLEGRESPEMYLKTIYSLWKEKGYCRSVDIARQLKVSRPSVSVAVNKLKQENCLTINEDGMILLTEGGRERAEIVSDKFCFWVKLLEKLGMDSDMAQVEACRLEHAMSDDAFLQVQHSEYLSDKESE